VAGRLRELTIYKHLKPSELALVDTLCYVIITSEIINEERNPLTKINLGPYTPEHINCLTGERPVTQMTSVIEGA
jgi:hypothetical protein